MVVSTAVFGLPLLGSVDLSALTKPHRTY